MSRLREALRLTLRRRPVTADALPRPGRAAAGARTLKLTHVVVSSDLNPRYLECWPLARRAWQEIASLEPVLVLVAPQERVPPALRADASVHVFPPVDGIHHALQSQCIRLLYPALLDAGGVITSDVDMTPLNHAYFHDPARRIDERHFLSYRNALLAGGEIPICYNAALPATWADVFGVNDLEDIRTRLGEWGTGLRYDAIRGGHGWDTDQVVLYRTLMERGRRLRDVWILDDRFSGHRRLVIPPGARDQPVPEVRRDIELGRYSDFHLLHPFRDNRELNERVVELARAGVGRRARV
jgi:hypothetical protein